MNTKVYHIDKQLSSVLSTYPNTLYRIKELQVSPQVDYLRFKYCHIEGFFDIKTFENI